MLGFMLQPNLLDWFMVRVRFRAKLAASIERTRFGGAGLAFISFWAKPAPPPQAAHVKR